MSDMTSLKAVTLYTDGACIGNPGPGGYGVILIADDRRKELSAGYQLTTNNRMEILAVIAGLEALKVPCAVTIYTDSQYVANTISLGWAKKWRDNGWMRSKKDRATNADLWARVLYLTEQHRVNVQWIKGHAGQPENERCDRLSVAAASGRDLAEDTGYLLTLSPQEAHDARKNLAVALQPDNSIASVRLDNAYMFVLFRDERELRFPLAWFPALLAATPAQRSHFELASDASVVQFPDVQVEISMSYVLGHDVATHC